MLEELNWGYGTNPDSCIVNNTMNLFNFCFPLISMISTIDINADHFTKPDCNVFFVPN